MSRKLLRITRLAYREFYLVIIAQIHMKIWPKAKLVRVGLGLNIAQNHFSNP